MTNDEPDPLQVKSGRYEMSDGVINFETWSNDVGVEVTNPSVFVPIEDDSPTLSLGFVAQDEEGEDDAPAADFASFSASLTPEQAEALGEALIEMAQRDPDRIGSTYDGEE